MKSKKQLAKDAIDKGRTMGQFLRELPGSDRMTPAKLETYAKAYYSVVQSNTDSTAIQRLTSKAGKASAAKLTPAQRTARARKAGLARAAKAHNERGGR